MQYSNQKHSNKLHGDLLVKAYKLKQKYQKDKTKNQPSQ